jgi:hypothetical protein
MVIGNFQAAAGLDVKLINGISSLALIILAMYLVAIALLKLRTDRRTGTLEPQPAAT